MNRHEGLRGVAIRQALSERASEGVLPRRVQGEIAAAFGLTHQRIQQISAEMGLKASRGEIASAVYLACASCGVRPVWGWRTGGVQCVECKRVPVMCDYCGIVIYREEAQILNNARNGRGMATGISRAVQCSRAGKKRCPRSPAMFVLQLGREWQKTWLPETTYITAASTFANRHAIPVNRERRDDGYWMRLAS